MIGNSWGATFPKQMLAYAGIHWNDEISIVAERGKIIIEKAVLTKITIDFTPDEADALARSDFESDAGQSALQKVKIRNAGSKSIGTIAQG